jgi:hypothetical protein
MKLVKEITIKDGRSISKVIDEAIRSASCYRFMDSDKALNMLISSMSTLSNLLRESVPSKE